MGAMRAVVRGGLILVEHRFAVGVLSKRRMSDRTRSAGFQPAVSPISNRQIAGSRRALPRLRAFGGLKTRDTAGWKPALRVAAKAGVLAHKMRAGYGTARAL
jgi:hypothetical protein